MSELLCKICNQPAARYNTGVVIQYSHTDGHCAEIKLEDVLEAASREYTDNPQSGLRILRRLFETNETVNFSVK